MSTCPRLVPTPIGFTRCSRDVGHAGNCRPDPVAFDRARDEGAFVASEKGLSERVRRYEAALEHLAARGYTIARAALLGLDPEDDEAVAAAWAARERGGGA